LFGLVFIIQFVSRVSKVFCVSKLLVVSILFQGIKVTHC